MKLAEFDFELPRDLIAQQPARPRDHARLLVYDRASKKLSDDHFFNLDKNLVKDSTIVLNDSKVEKNRLRFGKVEIFVLEELQPKIVRAWIKPGQKFKSGDRLNLDRLKVRVRAVEPDGVRVLELDRSIDDPTIAKRRLTPFPPYIKADEKLARDYQTVYAKPAGSKAAPTAGLHFTAKMLKKIEAKHPLAKITLHVGLGTFAPLRQENLKSGKLHEEWFDLNLPTAQILNKSMHITAVGTTTCRVLETISRPFKPTSGQTDIFIQPGYRFRAVDSLITNFHLPKSSLIMLVSAFIGSVSETQRLYRHAIESRYRFYSFGDAMLVL